MLESGKADGVGAVGIENSKRHVGNRLGQLQPAMWSCFVVVADVRVEDGFEMSL